jgi:hypothetical protein
MITIYRIWFAIRLAQMLFHSYVFVQSVRNVAYDEDIY